MKKTIGKYMVVGMVALTMTACNDSFLERTPTNNLNDAMYWKSEADLKAYAMVFIMKRQAMALTNLW